MKLRMFISALVLTSTAFSVNAAMQSSENTSAMQLAGKYSCQGKNPFGKEEIAKDLEVAKKGETYHFTWKTKNWEVKKTVGIADEGKGIVVSSFLNTEDPKYNGVIMYKIMSNGDLSGRWAIVGATQIATELCKKVS